MKGHWTLWIFALTCALVEGSVESAGGAEGFKSELSKCAYESAAGCANTSGWTISEEEAAASPRKCWFPMTMHNQISWNQARVYATPYSHGASLIFDLEFRQ